eukprot:CAMPEP_0172506014 /NCGR_PEP_ID=MMETSP1066-20121228/191198_1 /TAXON_ID=671091 /ORGANISM="Coscinodiscus wailesii, Strain CCMP2513" /LENGTH=41 /DNA_ID= /DNA_START= /DNA_END= /DNA_ORIENTATION=
MNINMFARDGDANSTDCPPLCQAMTPPMEAHPPLYRVMQAM